VREKQESSIKEHPLKLQKLLLAHISEVKCPVHLVSFIVVLVFDGSLQL